MLEERAALEGVRSHSVLELIQNQSLRWQLLTILVGFTALQLCGINAVSHGKPAPLKHTPARGSRAFTKNRLGDSFKMCK